MISSVTGELREVGDDRISLGVGPITCELLIAAADIQLLAAGVGEEMTFHTIFYLQGDASGGNIEPRLVGFLRKEDKRFFEKFITVKGIGPRKALKALALPTGEIAQAIESKDAKFLTQLPEIGKRMAEQIVAELAGKVQEFATAYTGATMGGAGGHRPRSPIEEDAIAALMALGERRMDAEHLLDRAKQLSPNVKTTAALVGEMLRLRTVRA